MIFIFYTSFFKIKCKPGDSLLKRIEKSGLLLNNFIIKKKIDAYLNFLLFFLRCKWEWYYNDRGQKIVGQHETLHVGHANQVCCLSEKEEGALACYF